MVDREKIEAELDEIVEECRGCDYVRFSVVVEHCTNIRELLSELEWHPKIVVAGEERSGMADRELLLERLERLAIVLDELMPQCAELVREALALLKEREEDRIEIAHEMVSNSILMYQGKELVRCKDCKHNTSSPHNPVCELDVYRSGGVDWYCADGERKEGR